MSRCIWVIWHGHPSAYTKSLWKLWNNNIVFTCECWLGSFGHVMEDIEDGLVDDNYTMMAGMTNNWGARRVAPDISCVVYRHSRQSSQRLSSLSLRQWPWPWKQLHTSFGAARHFLGRLLLSILFGYLDGLSLTSKIVCGTVGLRLDWFLANQSIYFCSQQVSAIFFFAQQTSNLSGWSRMLWWRYCPTKQKFQWKRACAVHRMP